ncbi:polysaccharide pyruvyl transferase family protein [uncultured Friedmanniella sp.]|uniref:polysaccharide pyruvyl transferase family protein n=1 Tax=uncultured Friedmanniella sp. TaxID=335381 RepID=UPI0035CBCB86
MRALVLWADDTSPNLGVQALAAGSAALVQRAYPGAELSFLSYGRGEAPVKVGDPRALGKEMVTGRAGLKGWLRGFDLVVDTRAGDSFADIYGLNRLYAMSLLAEAVHRSGTPLVMSPQTIGPFSGRRAKLIARRTLHTATLVMTRDRLSADHAKTLGRPVDHLTTDVVFAIEAPDRVVTRDVLLNVSGLLWTPGPHVDSVAYRALVADLYARLVAAGRTVTLLAHVLDSDVADNDVPAIAEFAATLDHQPEVLVPTSLSDVRQMVASANVVIGSRMHACLNALSVGTPAIALAYSRKFAPLLEDIGWTRTIDLRTAPDVAGDVEAILATPTLEQECATALARARSTVAGAEERLRGLAL